MIVFSSPFTREQFTVRVDGKNVGRSEALQQHVERLRVRGFPHFFDMDYVRSGLRRESGTGGEMIDGRTAEGYEIEEAGTGLGQRRRGGTCGE